MSFKHNECPEIRAKLEKDILQQNIGIIKMEEKIILKEILKLEHWLKLEFLLISSALVGIGGMFIWNLSS